LVRFEGQSGLRLSDGRLRVAQGLTRATPGELAKAIGVTEATHRHSVVTRRCTRLSPLDGKGHSRTRTARVALRGAVSCGQALLAFYIQDSWAAWVGRRA